MKFDPGVAGNYAMKSCHSVVSDKVLNIIVWWISYPLLCHHIMWFIACQRPFLKKICPLGSIVFLLILTLFGLLSRLLFECSPQIIKISAILPLERKLLFYFDILQFLVKSHMIWFKFALFLGLVADIGQYTAWPALVGLVGLYVDFLICEL